MTNLTKFNNSETLAIVSPYYSKNRGDFRGYSIARYTNLLVNSYPKNQKVVIFCEKREENETPYQSQENILVVPTYKFNSTNFFGQILAQMSKFGNVKDILIQFEFSIFGGKKIIPSFLLSLLMLRILNKNISIVLHQVVTDLNELLGHLGLHRKPLSVTAFNMLLRAFYSIVGYLSNHVIVHDKMLLARLSNFVNKSKIKVIPHAVGDENVIETTPKLTNIARKDYNLKKEDKVIAVYGYRSWYKGTDWIVKTISELSNRYPKQNLKLLVAGGVSPTLKNTEAYKSFDKKLKSVIKIANGSVRVTGFIPEKDVWKVFAASDLIVFPYRTRMSASGAFNLALTYKKPFLVSSAFSDGINLKLKDVIFDLNTFSFEGKLFNILKDRKLRARLELFSNAQVTNKSWVEVAQSYLAVAKSGNILVDGNFDENYELVEA